MMLGINSTSHNKLLEPNDCWVEKLQSASLELRVNATKVKCCMGSQAIDDGRWTMVL